MAKESASGKEREGHSEEERGMEWCGREWVAWQIYST